MHKEVKPFFKAAGGACLLVALGIFLSRVTPPLIRIFPDGVQESLFLAAIINGLPLAVLAFLGYAARKGSWREVFPFAVPAPVDLLFILITAAGLSILMSEANNFFSFFFPAPPEIIEQFKHIITGGSIFAAFFLVSFIAPLTEEYFFRGIVFKWFLENCRAPVALAFSSFLFAFFHLNPWQFFGAFFGGLVLGWVYYKTGSLFHVVLLHGLNNGLTVFAVRSNIVIKGYSSLDGVHGFQPFWFDEAGVMLLCMGIWYFCIRHKKAC